jgi:hypothetical protein
MTADTVTPITPAKELPSRELLEARLIEYQDRLFNAAAILEIARDALEEVVASCNEDSNKAHSISRVLRTARDIVYETAVHMDDAEALDPAVGELERARFERLNAEEEAGE